METDASLLKQLTAGVSDRDRGASRRSRRRMARHAAAVVVLMDVRQVEKLVEVVVEEVVEEVEAVAEVEEALPQEEVVELDLRLDQAARTHHPYPETEIHSESPFQDQPIPHLIRSSGKSLLPCK